MPKRSITDFFKPYANTHQNIISCLDDKSTKPRTSSIECKTAASQTSIEEDNHPIAPKDSFLISSQSSLLSSLRSETPSTPGKRLSQHHESTDTFPKDITRARDHLEDDVGSQDTSFVTSGQRVVKDGEIVVQDSDDDGSDSDTSLEDLSNLFASRKPIISSSRFPSDSKPIQSSRAIKSDKQNASSGPAIDPSSISTSIPSYKFSLDALLQQNRQSEDSKTSVDNARHLLESMEKQNPPPAERASNTLDRCLLASVMDDQDDTSHAQRLLVAIERTEAFHQDVVWSFFDEEKEASAIEPADCPLVADPYWRSIIKGWFSYGFLQF
ncbi:MAG: hypothetical protein Q9222_003207 [Ikaeria aurantiellina]